MTFMWRVGIAILLPAAVSAADLCRDSKTTLDMNQCLSDQITLAEKELAKYLEESRRRVANDPRTLAEFEKAQTAWVAFRDAHCGAIYQFWAQGSVRGAMAGYCLLKQTRRRTYDLRDAYLTYVDTTPPILPEPKLSENDK
jgi:uncharacterized protein YecT (DUF1311 family)